MSDVKKYIVACNGIELALDAKDSNLLHLNNSKDDANGNVRIELQSFVDSVLKLDVRLKDLLIIAGYVFAADRKTLRGAIDAVEFHSWSRSIDLHITVSDVSFWNQPKIKRLLNECLTWMTGDKDWQFYFYSGNGYNPCNIFDNSEKFTLENNDDMKVMLFSGGLDSLAGVIEMLETTKSELCLVTHQSGNPFVQKTQNDLYKEINERYPNRCKHYKFKCGLSKIVSCDETQRTRAFLFNSIAFAISKTYGKDSVSVFENGITTLNFAETQDQMNSRSSRTTHPKTLGLLSELFSEIAGSRFVIKNEYLYKTKTHIMEVLKKYNKKELLDMTVSCSQTRNHPPQFTHCGICFQCIDRRFASYAADVNDYDENGLYYFDFLKDELIERDKVKPLVDYIRLAQSYAQLNLEAFYYKFTYDLLEMEDYLEGKGDSDKFGKIYQLCLSHSSQIEKALELMRKRYDKPFSPVKRNSIFEIIGKRLYQSEDYEKEIEGIGKKEIQAASCENDLVIEKIKAECERKNLQKGRTIKKEILYEIAKNVGFNVPDDLKQFTTGESNYQKMREYASRLGYKRKKERNY